MSKRPMTENGKRSRLRLPVGRLRDLPIWSKLGLIMVVPTFATVVVGILALLANVSQLNNTDRARVLSQLSGQASGLVHELQNERASGTILLGVPSNESQAAFEKQTPITDDAIKNYRLRRSALATPPADFRTRLDQIDVALSDLPTLRDKVKAHGDVSATDFIFKYGVLIDDLLSIRDSSAQLAGSEDLGADMRAASEISNAKEQAAEERVVVLQMLIAKNIEPDNQRAFIGALEGTDQAIRKFQDVAKPDQKALYDQTVTGSDQREAKKFEDTINIAQPGKLPDGIFTTSAWENAMVGRANLIRKVETTLDDRITAAATVARDRLQRQVLIETGGLLAVLLLAILFAWMVARSMARSLRELRHGALTVAQYGLPQAVARLRDPTLATQATPQQLATQLADPLPVRSRDEFGQVAEAFNAVHLEAVRTAAEQAALRASVAQMFVNLARRSQILVDRLIGHLDRLERGEEDPDRLAELFQLDHLATRMRRNDENLLVLAGADSTRIQRDPAPLMDMLRAAQSEVEHYTRIEFGMIDRDVEIAAHAVNDMVHLVAELLDNATAFSPPDSAVIVEARRVGDRAVLLVEDRGIGISPDQLSELNERLANPPMVDVAVSRMMGLVVVARLAARHGVKVELRPARERGTVADITLPSSVLVPRALAGRAAGGGPIAGALSRPAPPPAQRSPFAPPLALESGPGTGNLPPSAPRRDPLPLGGREPLPLGGRDPVPMGSRDGSLNNDGPPRREPAGAGSGGFGAPPAGTGGLGAALGATGGGTFTPPGPGFGGPSAPRPQPAWSDLIGVNGSDLRPPSRSPVPPSIGEPLPQRRTPERWPGDQPPPPSTDERDRSIPRQPGPVGDAPPAPPTPPEAAAGAPPVPAPSAPPVPAAPPAPPAWPPVPETPEAESPPVPESLTKALDMTAEIPRVRVEWESDEAESGAGANGDPGRRFADQTMELPIFRELESAWFRTRKSAPPDTSPGLTAPGGVTAGDGAEAMPGAVSPEPAEEPVRAEPVRAESARAAVAPDVESPPAEAAAEPEVSWQTAADDGWRAASALAEEQEFTTTSTGLPKRVPMSQLVPGGVEKATASVQRRSPEAVRGLLSAYHRGVQRGRTTKSADPKTPEHTTAGPQNSQAGKEQEG